MRPPLELVPRAGEVEAIFEIPLHRALDSRSYRLHRVGDRAHFSLEHRGTVVAGPTVSILMGLYEELLKTHPPPA